MVVHHSNAHHCARVISLCSFSRCIASYSLFRSFKGRKKEGRTMDKNKRLFKGLLIFLNVGLVILGIIIAVNEITILSRIISLMEEGFKPRSLPLILPALLSLAQVVLGCFGCWVTWKEHAKGLTNYGTWLTIFCAYQFATGFFIFMGLSRSRKLQDSLIPQITKQFKSYSDSPSAKAYIDALQTTLKCCGLTSPTDFEDGSIPQSCCNTTLHTLCNNLEDMYQAGCKSKVAMYFEDNSAIKVHTAIILGTIMLYGIHLTSCLLKTIKADEADRCQGQEEASA